MKGFMLFFILFGLLVSMSGNPTGDNSTVAPSDLTYDSQAAVSVEEVKPEVTPSVSVEAAPVYEKPVEEVVPISSDLAAENLNYEVTIEPGDYTYWKAIRPQYTDNEKVICTQLSTNGDQYMTVVLYEDKKTHKLDVHAFLQTDLTAFNMDSVCQRSDGGFFGMADRYVDDVSEHYLVSFSAADDMATEMECIRQIDDDFDFENVFLRTEDVTDGTYLYIPYIYWDGSAGGVLMYDKELNLVKEVISVKNPYVCMGDDGYLYIYDAFESKIYQYDPAIDHLLECEMGDAYGCFLYNGGGRELLFGDDNLYSFNVETCELIKLFNFEEQGVKADYFDFVYRDANGDIIVLYESFADGSQRQLECYKATFKVTE